MSTQYVVVVYTKSVRYNPYKVTQTQGVLGPFDFDTAQEVSRGQYSGTVYRLDEWLDPCPGCGHPECSIYAAQWGRGK